MSTLHKENKDFCYAYESWRGEKWEWKIGREQNHPMNSGDKEIEAFYQGFMAAKRGHKYYLEKIKTIQNIEEQIKLLVKDLKKNGVHTPTIDEYFDELKHDRIEKETEDPFRDYKFDHYGTSSECHRAVVSRVDKKALDIQVRKVFGKTVGYLGKDAETLGITNAPERVISLDYKKAYIMIKWSLGVK